MNKLSLKKKVVKYLLQDDTELEVTGTTELMQTNNKCIESTVGFRFNIVGADTLGTIFRYHVETEKEDDISYELCLQYNNQKLLITSEEKGVVNEELQDDLAALFCRLDPACQDDDSEEETTNHRCNNCSCDCNSDGDCDCDKEYTTEIPEDADKNIYDKDGNIIGKLLPEPKPLITVTHEEKLPENIREELFNLIEGFLN